MMWSTLLTTDVLLMLPFTIVHHIPLNLDFLVEFYTFLGFYLKRKTN